MDEYGEHVGVPPWPRWELQAYGTAAESLPPWAGVRLTFADGARLDVLAVVAGGRVAIEDLRAEPPLPLDALAGLTGRIQVPLEQACRVISGPAGTGNPAAADAGQACRTAGSQGAADTAAHPPNAVDSTQDVAEALAGPRGEADAAGGRPERGRRRRSTPLRGSEARRLAAETYRAAQSQGRDPVLAVMALTGHSRRRTLRLIAAARDAGFLAPRHRGGAGARS